MSKPRLTNPWLAALASWVLATVVVVGIYAVWLWSQGESLRWDIVRDAAAIAAVPAVIRAWRDRAQKGS